ncbi:MAG: hypothetical protein M0000_07395 [Actinomycetota bacterium]|nr:hypothetical protein [Actinomycetota bacterium]
MTTPPDTKPAQLEADIADAKAVVTALMQGDFASAESIAAATVGLDRALLVLFGEFLIYLRAAGVTEIGDKWTRFCIASAR